MDLGEELHSCRVHISHVAKIYAQQLRPEGRNQRPPGPVEFSGEGSGKPSLKF